MNEPRQELAEVPSQEGPPLLVMVKSWKNVGMWLFACFVVFVGDSMVPLPGFLEPFVQRINVTEILEFLLTAGTTILALAATSAAVIWQLVLQKFSGTFVQFILNRTSIVSYWLFAAVSTGLMLFLWIATYDTPVEGSAHLFAKSWFGLVTFVSVTYVVSIGGCIRGLSDLIGDISPRALLKQLALSVESQWTELARMSRSNNVSKVELRHAIQWTENLIPNIARVGLTAVRDGDLELVRAVAKTLAAVYSKADCIDFLRLGDLIEENELDTENPKLWDRYWPQGLVIGEIRNLVIHTLNHRDPGFSEVQHLKLLGEWEALMHQSRPEQVLVWNKLLAELFQTSMANRQAGVGYRLASMSVRFYETFWQGMKEETLAEYHRFSPSLAEILRLITSEAHYCIVYHDIPTLKTVADGLTHIRELHAMDAPSHVQKLGEMLTRRYILPGLFECGIKAIHDKKYDCAGELLRRLVFFLSPADLFNLLNLPRNWQPPPPLLNAAPNPMVGRASDYYRYQEKKLCVLVMSYADFHAKTGLLPTSLRLVPDQVPKWFLDSAAQLETLRQDFLGRSDIWQDLFLGEADKQLKEAFRCFSRARQLAEK